MCWAKIDRPKLEPRFSEGLGLAHIIKQFGKAFRARGGVCKHHLRTLRAIEVCRTSELGGHMRCCRSCGSLKIRYNSCRNRHCPKCGGLERECWIRARENELLPVRYQHLVFTLPAELHPFCRYHSGLCYDLLFKAAWQTLDIFGRDPKWLGARLGATMVLHTWGQNLMLHPHIHCILPSGGLGKNGDWISAKKSGRSGFLFPVKAMSKVFRAIYLRAFMQAWRSGKLVIPPAAPTKEKDIQKWRRNLHRKDWIVFAKAPFGSPKSVVEYLGRYTHKTAISNHRLIKIESNRVFFRYKDYRDGAKQKVMSLDGLEFLRRFCLHILPSGFRRMRHYGVLSNFHKTKALAAARKSLSVTHPESKPTKLELKKRIIEDWLARPLTDCPDCGANDSLIRILLPPNSRAPPPGELIVVT